MGGDDDYDDTTTTPRQRTDLGLRIRTAPAVRVPALRRNHETALPAVVRRVPRGHARYERTRGMREDAILVPIDRRRVRKISFIRQR